MAVIGERKRLVLTHLLHNAVKYTPPGGQLGLLVNHHAGMVVLHVSDNGIGVDPGLMPPIFELITKEKRATGAATGWSAHRCA